MFNARIPLVSLFAFCMCICWPGFTQIAGAQSDADLRRENQRLTAENENLTRELEAARERIALLEREVGRLARALHEAGRGDVVDVDETPEKPAGPGSIDPDDPSASPRTLLAALKSSYGEAMGEMSYGRPGSREWNLYMRGLSQWRNRVNRELRAPIEWHVRVVDAQPTSAGYAMRLAVIDPKNQEQHGEAFTIVIPRAQARRYEFLASRDEVGIFVLRGTLTPEVRINESRATSGPFDNPTLIGPFAEFGFSIESRSFMPVEEKPDEEG